MLHKIETTLKRKIKLKNHMKSISQILKPKHSLNQNMSISIVFTQWHPSVNIQLII